MNTLIETLGWTLLHFLWQGTLAAALLWCGLRLLRSAPASWRYALSGFALVAMLVAATATGARQWQNASFRSAALPLRASDTSVSPPVSPPAKPATITSAESNANPPAAAEVDSTAAPSEADPSPKEASDLRQTLRPLMPWIVALWAAGVAFLSIRFVRSWGALRRLRSHAKASDDDATNTIFARLLDTMGLQRSVLLLTTTEAVVPMVIGWLKPVILVPVSLFAHLPAWQIEAILAHELAHVRRHDYLVNLLQNVVETLFFYHPAVWWVSGQLRKEREHCCDDVAAATCGGALDYARALTALEEMRGRVPAGALSAAGGSLLHRVRRLLGVPVCQPGTVLSWPVGAVVAMLAAGLLVGVHLARAEDGSEPDKLPDAPGHEMATALLKRWQLLEEKDSPISESRVAGLRQIIEKHIEEAPTTAKERETLVRYQNWHADRLDHGIADLLRLLNAVAAEEPELIQLAFNHEPWRGNVVDQDATKFGPAAPNGLRASWSLGANEKTYVLGDVVHGYLTLWNTGEQTLMTGNGLGPDAPGLRPEPSFQIRGEDGREIAVTTEPVDPVNFTAKWILKPGESAVIGGYRIKIGTGDERHATFKPKHSSEFAIADLRGGEVVTMNVSFPYPKAPSDPNTYAKLVANGLAFEVADAKDIEVWAITGYGTWRMANGVSLEVRGENLHRADMLTSAILTWPDGKGLKIHVAADAFANREPWAVAWETGQPILWIASGSLIPMGKHDREMPVPANSLKRIDFSDPQRVEETYLSGWPEEGGPSAECRAAMEERLSVKANGQASSRAIQWATANPTQFWLNGLGINVYLEKGGETFHIGKPSLPPGNNEPESQPLAELEETLRAEAAEKLAKWEQYKTTMTPQERDIMGDVSKARPSVTLHAPASVPFSSVAKAIEACEAANVGSQVTLSRSAPEGASVRGIPLEGLPQSDDITNFADLYEADPKQPGEVRMKRGVFFMSLGAVGPWVYFPANGVHFYLSVRPDPEVVSDVIYGPIPGHPVEKLNLRDWLDDSPNHRDPGYARRVTRDMIRCGDDALAPLAFEWIGDFAPPSPPDEHDEMIALLTEFERDFPQAPSLEFARKLRGKLGAMAESAGFAWDAKRPKLPDEDYQPGVPYDDEEHAGILWGESPDAPLRLGIAGLANRAHWRPGDTVSFDLYVRNEGSEPVRFAWTPRIDEGLSVELVDGAGTVHHANIAQFSTLIFHNRCKLEPAHVLKVKSGATFVIGKPEGAAGRNYIPLAKSGKYTLRTTCHLGIRDWTDHRGTEIVRPAGEWEGTLQAKPLDITLVTADAPAAPWHAETSSVLTKWREAYGEKGVIPAEAMTWLADKIDTFITQYPGEDAEKLKALLPALKREQDWSWSEAQTKLDAVADIATAPVGWLDLDESFRSFERVKPGEAWPEEKLAELPFGPPSENGLRVAWIFDPMKKEYRIGEVVKCRIIFHNSGREAVEFVTDQWHQEDTWHVTDPAGTEIPTKGTWFTGVTPYQRYKLEPGQTCEVAGHGVGIGVAEFAEATSQAQVGQQILAKPGDEVRCKWDVSLRAAWKQPDPAGDTNPTTLTTGEVAFKVIAALPVGERPPGVAKSTGSFDLAPGIVLNVSQIGSDKGYENLAWIAWDKDNGAGDNGKVDLTLPRNADPKDYAVPTFVWPRGGSALWIVQSDKLRKIDFSTVGEAKETHWEWDEVPEDFGGAREDVREEITKQRPSRKEQSYLDRPPSEGDERPQVDAHHEGLVILVTDAETNAPIESFRVLAGVPSGVSRGFEAAQNTTVINWQSHTIKLGKDGEFTWPADKGYDEMALRVEADGFVPQVIHGLRKGAAEIFNLKLRRDLGIAGSVQTPGGGRAAHDATVVLAMIRRDARLKGSTLPELVLGKGDSLRDQWDRPTVVQPDEQGRFTLSDEPDPTAVVLILHGDGVYVQPFAEWKKAPDVTLEPWGRVHGRIHFGDTAGADETVHLIVNRGDAYGYPDIIAQYDDTTADENGQFVFERVLPGMVQLSAPIEVEQETGGKATVNLSERTVHVDIRAPHTPIMIGGRGRTLMGKLVGLDNRDGVTFRIHPTAPHFGRPGDDTMWKAWHALRSGPFGPLFFRDGLKVADEGTFEIPGVLPGSYQVFFTREGEKQHLASGEFRVPKEERDEAPESLDVGEFRVR